MKRLIVSAMILMSVGMASPSAQTTYIKGSASASAKKPYTSYIVRLRDTATNIVQMQPLNARGEFFWNNVDRVSYLVELVDPQGKVVCTEGPMDLQKKPYQHVTIKCEGSAMWWLLAAAAGAGITAGIVAGGTTSPSR